MANRPRRNTVADMYLNTQIFNVFVYPKSQRGTKENDFVRRICYLPSSRCLEVAVCLCLAPFCKRIFAFNSTVGPSVCRTPKPLLVRDGPAPAFVEEGAGKEKREKEGLHTQPRALSVLHRPRWQRGLV